MKRSLEGLCGLLHVNEVRDAMRAVYRGKGTPLQKKLIFGGAAGIGLVLVGIIFILFSTPVQKMPPAAQGGQIYYTVRPGMTVGEIGKELHEQGIIESEFKFWWTAKLNGFENKVKSGTFALHAGMTPRDALETLVYGNTVTVRFVIPEGFNVRDIAERLSDEGIFPATYEINGSFDTARILEMMAENFDRRLTPEMRERAKEENLSIYELVTLASIVEKEAYHEEDRPIIAQIFLKRLKLGMPLQADPTVQYLLDAPKEDLLLRDTKIESPYNTYQNAGLPPGPIASPGTASLMAVLHPAETDYLYFVADRSGNNYYATNYADHLALVDRVR